MTCRSYIMLAGCLLSLGCNSTGVGNPGSIDSISLAITVDESDTVPTDTDATDLEPLDAAEPVDAATMDESDPDSLPGKTVRHAILVLRELRWLACNPDQPSQTIKGPFLIDLVAKTSTPALPSVSAPPDGFCGIDAPLTAATAPATLAGRSVFFDGVRADGALFIVYANVKATLRLRAKHEIHGERVGTPKLLWAFRPRRWLKRHELELADTIQWDDQMRAVVIDANRHPVLFLALRKRLAGESTLYADRKQNGIVDQDDPAIGFGSDDAD